MPDLRKLRGTVRDMHTKSRYEGATVRLQREGCEPAFANADDDGDFEFNLTDEAMWPAGDYTLTVFHPDSRQAEAIKKIKLEAGKAPEFQWVEMLSDQERSDRAGWAFLGMLVLLLGALFWGFLTLHRDHPNKGLPLDESLAALVELAQVQAGETVSVTASSSVSTTIAAAELAFTSLRDEPEQTLISDRRGQMIAILFAEARTAIEAEDETGLKTVLTRLGKAVAQPASYFWQSDPWRLVEILMWALAATIISLAINTGGYLYRRNFHWRAIPSRVALLVTVPILAVVIAFVLSLVTISVTVSGATFKLDMSNVTMSILVAVLIGLAPWKAWAFLNGLASLFFEKLTVGAREPAPAPPQPTPPSPPAERPEAAPPPEPAPPSPPGERLRVAPVQPAEPVPSEEEPRTEPRQPTSTPRRSGPSEDWGL